MILKLLSKNTVYGLVCKTRLSRLWLHCILASFLLAACKEPTPRPQPGGSVNNPSRSMQPAPLTPIQDVPSRSANTAATVGPKATEKISNFEKIGCGHASYYGSEFSGQPTANGESFDPSKYTAAHRTLSFGTKLLVVKQGKTPTKESDGVVVKINDRGPFVAGRLIDLSTASFAKIASTSEGVAEVCLYKWQ